MVIVNLFYKAQQNPALKQGLAIRP